MDLSARKGPIRLNIGAGSKVVLGFLSVGLDPGHDIRCDFRAIPVPTASVDEAIAIHVLEHVWRWECGDALREWFRIMKPGGMLAIEMPDLVKCCRNVVAGLPESMGIRGLYGDQTFRDPLMTHRWLYTEDEIKAELRAAGFAKVRSATPQFHGRRIARDMRVEAWA